jgi:hypothetical protein
MKRASYACVFSFAVLTLSIGGLMAFRRLEAETEAAHAASVARAVMPAHKPSPKPFVPITPDPAEYEKYAAEDARWRRENARPYTLAELRARGDGTRSPREQMHDRVFEYQRRGQRARAIAELERWVTRNPRDPQAMLTLARLLNESGREGDAVLRYRQLLVMQERR